MEISKMTIGVGAAAALAALLAAGCSHSKSSGEMPEETVDVALPVRDSVVLSSSYPGVLTAGKRVDVVGRVNGQLMSQNYTNGQAVGKGAVLFRIEDTRYRDAVAQASAQLASARSQREYASSHYAAVERALASDAVSKMEVEQARSALSQSESAISSAAAALETARKNLAYCTVTAPIAGEVSAAAYDVGTYIGGEGMPVTLATIFDNSVMTVTFYIEDTRYLELLNGGKGEKGELKEIPLQFSDTLPHSYTGELTYMAPALNKSTGTMEMRCSVANPYGELKPGMFVRVNLPYGGRQDAILVKDAAISSDQLGKYLYVVTDSGKVVYTPVKVGETVDDTMRIVTSGLRAGEKYVTKAMLKVRDGMQVKTRLVK